MNTTLSSNNKEASWLHAELFSFICMHTMPSCACTPRPCVHAHHALMCVHTTPSCACTPRRGVHFSQISLQSHVTTHLSQSECSILSNLSVLVRNCEISPKIFPPFKEQSCYNSSARNKGPSFYFLTKSPQAQPCWQIRVGCTAILHTGQKIHLFLGHLSEHCEHSSPSSTGALSFTEKSFSIYYVVASVQGLKHTENSKKKFKMVNNLHFLTGACPLVSLL